MHTISWGPLGSMPALGRTAGMMVELKRGSHEQPTGRPQQRTAHVLASKRPRGVHQKSNAHGPHAPVTAGEGILLDRTWRAAERQAGGGRSARSSRRG